MYISVASNRYLCAVITLELYSFLAFRYIVDYSMYSHHLTFKTNLSYNYMFISPDQCLPFLLFQAIVITILLYVNVAF